MIVEMARPGTINRNRGGGVVPGKECGCGGCVGCGVKANQKQKTMGRQRNSCWEIIADTVTQTPGVGWMIMVVKRHRRITVVEQFDEFVPCVIGGDPIGNCVQRVIIDFADDNGSDLRPDIFGAERKGRLSDELLLSAAGQVTAKADTFG